MAYRVGTAVTGIAGDEARLVKTHPEKVEGVPAPVVVAKQGPSRSTRRAASTSTGPSLHRCPLARPMRPRRSNVVAHEPEAFRTVVPSPTTVHRKQSLTPPRDSRGGENTNSRGSLGVASDD